MASAFGHMAVAYAMRKTLYPTWASTRFWVLTVLCCLLPDADVLGLVFGIPYEHMWGHRGLTHSIAVAVLVGIIGAKVAVPTLSCWRREYGFLAIYFSLVTLSHGFLDAFTDGGLGIAFFAPFVRHVTSSPGDPLRCLPLAFQNFFRLGGWACF